MTSDHQSQQPALTSSVSTQRDPAPAESSKPKFNYTTKQYESLASQLNTYVTVSIFAVAAIVAIVAFVRDTIDSKENDPSTPMWQFEVGKFLCMVVIGLHFGVIIVGGRAWALCFRLAAGCDTSLDLEAASQDQKSNSEYAWDHIDRYRKIPFYRYVAYCERVQLIGTLLLLISMLLMQFALFSNKIFSWIFLGVPATLAVSIYLTDFRH